MWSNNLWENDVTTTNLIRKLQSGLIIETRESLAPIYKWTKVDNKLYSTEKAFKFAEWIIFIQKHADDRLGVPCQSSIEPKFAINTIITMSQRANKPEDAQRAYALLKAHNMIPDVFTVTALLDVVGRSAIAGFHKALDIYGEDMLNGAQFRCLPNVVTFVTLLRIVGLHTPPESPQIIIKLLHDAHRLVARNLLALEDLSLSQPSSVPAAIIHLGGNPEVGSVDSSIYNAALAACHKIKSFPIAAKVMAMMGKHQAIVTTLTRKILAKIVHVCFGASEEELHSTFALLSRIEFHIRAIASASAFTAVAGGGAADYTALQELDHESLLLYFHHQFQGLPEMSSDMLSKQESSYAGCLGSDASDTLRQSVIEHDARKLLERLQVQKHCPVTESDFTTLVHQCRKRKWPLEVDYLLTFVKGLASEGHPELSIPPQPHLTPTLHGMFEACMDAYFASGFLDRAVQLFDEIIAQYDHDDAIENLTPFVYFCCKGFVTNKRVDLALHAYWSMRKRNFLPSRKLILGQSELSIIIPPPILVSIRY